jgi:multicomponent Na+:H+ antiporter subunit A
MILLAAVLSGFGLALAAPLVTRLARGAAGWLLAALPLGLALLFAGFAPRIAAGEPIREAYPWSAELGVTLALRLDGLSLLMALLILGVGALVLVYAGGYMAGKAGLGRFYGALLLFMASMLGLVLADNLLLLFVFWELTSISSYLLIAFDFQKTQARAAALQALLVTGGGGLVLLAGLIMLGLAGGTFEIAELLARSDVVRTSPLYLPVLLLVLVGAFTKSAQVPFHFWLPGAMEAPTPVSAYLHSATMVKAGVYLLARLSPMLAGTETWTATVGTVGALTMLLGGVLALFQTDLKRILAYSTVSALGTLVLLLGVGTPDAVTAAIVFLLAHALYKGALFMVAGALDHAAGTRDVERLGGLRRAMPITAAVAVLAAVSLAGFGPVLSFIGKELLFEALLEVEEIGALLAALAALAGALFVAVAGIVGVRPFFGPLRETPHAPHESPPSMWLGPGLLALAGLAIGIAPGSVGTLLVTPAAGAVMGEARPVELYLWHGLNVALGLSVAALLVGAGLYAAWARLRRFAPVLERVFGWGPSRVYGAVLSAVDRVALLLTRRVQSGFLRRYLLVIFVTALGLGTWALGRDAPAFGPLDWAGVRFYEAALVVLMLLAALWAVSSPSRLSAILGLGVVGYGVALIYILYGAPDLAMTQILVETLTVILFVLVFYHLPRFTSISPRWIVVRDAVVALAVGGIVTTLMLVANATPPESALAPFFLETARPLAHGRNVVNVILVDFRGIDTLGEITVLAVAAIGVFALLKLRPGAEDRERRTRRRARWTP